MIKKSILPVICLLLLSLFLLNTIIGSNSPQVGVDFARQGVIRQQASKYGTLARVDTERFFAPVSGRIVQIMEEDSRTTVASVLFTIADDNQTYTEVRIPRGTPLGRLVLDVMPDVGDYILEGTPVMTLGLMNHHFYVEVLLPQIYNFLYIGHPATVYIGGAFFDGVISRIIPEGGVNRVVVYLTAPHMTVGDTVEVSVIGEGTAHSYVIPLNALRQCRSGFYLLYVTAESRLLGTRYHVQRLCIDVLRRDDDNAAVAVLNGRELAGVSIVQDSGSPLRAGARVRLI